MARWAQAAVYSLLAVLLGLAVPASARAASEDEMQVHAAYLINFVRYSRWPRAHQGPLVISVLGTVENANTMRELSARAGLVNGRRLSVRLLPLASIPSGDADAVRAVERAAAGTHVLYVGSSHSGWARTVATAMTGHPVMTVGAGRNFVAAGGMFGLYPDEGNVRFAVNARVIKASSVDISARLLTLARPAGGN